MLQDWLNGDEWVQNWYHSIGHSVVTMTLSLLCMTSIPSEADETPAHKNQHFPPATQRRPSLSFHPRYYSTISHNLSPPRQFNTYATIIAIIGYYRQPLSSLHLSRLSSLTRNDARAYLRGIQTLLGISARRDSSYDIRGDHPGKAPWLGFFGICLQRMAARYREGELSSAEATVAPPRWF